MKKIVRWFTIAIFAFSLTGCRQKSTVEKIADKVYEASKNVEKDKGNLSRQKEREMDKQYKEAKSVVKDIWSVFH